MSDDIEVHDDVLGQGVFVADFQHSNHAVGVELVHRQRQQARPLFGENLGDGAIAIVRPWSLMRHFVAPLERLTIALLQRGKSAVSYTHLFEEIGSDTNTAYGQNGESTSSMGPVFADLEGRGLLDLWVTDGRYNRLLHNTGKMSFEDIGASNGVSQANAQYASWGTGVYDLSLIHI